MYRIMVENVTLVHAELIIIALITLLILIQGVLYLVQYINNRYTATLVRRNLRLKEERKRLKKEQHNKKTTSESGDVLDKFAGLVKPDNLPPESLEEKKPLQQDELALETPTESTDTDTKTAQTTNPSPSKPTTEDADPSLEQKKIYTHQDKLNTLRSEALRAKEKGQAAIYEKKLIEGLALEPEYTEFIKLLADHYFQTNEYKKALALLKRLLDHDKKNHRAMWQMGEIYLSHGDRKTAEIMIEQAVKHQQNNPRYLYSLVDIKYNTGKIDDAIYLMERILKLRPTNVEYLLATAMLYEEKGDTERAGRYYATILEYDPDNHTAKHKLKDI